MIPLNFRTAEIADLKEMQQLFVSTVREVCRKDYTSEQIAAWISGATDTTRWQDRIHEQFVLLAALNGRIIGYVTLRDGNYIDLLYVHKDFQEQGIGRQLLNRVKAEAKRLQEPVLTADVSITARLFFERNGFYILQQQVVQRQGIELENFKM